MKRSTFEHAGLKVSETMKLPLEWLTLATVVYGARGSGKTSLGRVLAEETVRVGPRFCAIDLKGDWWGLKSTADGKASAIPAVVFGGDHADVPLEEGAGTELARIVAELPQCTILDFEHLSKSKQLRFMAQFFAELYDRNREPLVLLMDEAQRYAPQKTFDPESAKCLGAVEDLVKLGRKHGIAPVLFTQRGSGLNKEVSELCDLLVAFRTPGPLDQRRVEDWLGANVTAKQAADVMSRLPGLATGTAVFASGHPDLKIFGVHAVRRPMTFDSSATPKIGERRIEPKALAKPDLDALRQKMATSIERAKADDPKELKRRIAELEKQVSGNRDAKPEKLTERVEVTVFDRADFDALQTEVRVLVDTAVERLMSVKGDVDKELVRYRKICEEKKAKPVIVSGRQGNASYAMVGRSVASKDIVHHVLGDGEPDPELGNAGPRRMLTTLAQSKKPLKRSQLGALADVSAAGGSFDTYLSRLRKPGWIENDSNGTIRITDAGRKALGKYEVLPTGRELVDYYVRQFGDSGTARMLRALADHYPESLPRAKLGELSNVSAAGGSFDTYLSRLRVRELITGKGELRLNDEIFN